MTLRLWTNRNWWIRINEQPITVNIIFKIFNQQIMKYQHQRHYQSVWFLSKDNINVNNNLIHLFGHQTLHCMQVSTRGQTCTIVTSLNLKAMWITPLNLEDDSYCYNISLICKDPSLQLWSIMSADELPPRLQHIQSHSINNQDILDLVRGVY